MRDSLTSRGILQRAALYAVVYAVVSAVYIWVSDHLLNELVNDPVRVRQISIMKGWAFVAFTSIVLLLVLWRLGMATRRASAAETASSRGEELWKALFDHAPDAALLLEGDRIVDANTNAGLLLGYAPHELVGMSPVDLSPPVQPDGTDSGEAARRFLAATKEGEVTHLSWRAVRRDGTEIEAEVSLSVLPGEPHRVLAFVRDVSEARAAARKLADQSEQMRLLVEGTRNFFFYVQNLKANVSYISPSVEQITGRPIRDWLGQHHWWATDNPMNESAIATTHRHLRGELDTEPVLVEVQHSDGHPVMLEIYEFGRYEDGKLVGLQGIAHDVTRRKRAEEALQRSEEHFRQMEEKYRKIFENAVEGIYQASSEGEYVTANPMMARILGFDSPEDLVAESTSREDHFYADPGRLDDLHHLLEDADSVSGLDSEMVRRDGTVIWVSESVRTLRDANGNLTGFEGSLVDITERKRAEEALRDSEETTRALLDAPEATALLLDGNGMVLAVNEMAAQSLGVPVAALMGNCLFDLFSQEQRERARRSLARVSGTGQRIRFVEEWRGRSYSISIYPVLDLRQKVSRLAVFARDITEQLRVEQARARLATAVEQAAEAIMITDIDGTIEYVNPAFERVTGYSHDEVLGDNARILKSGKHDAAFYAGMWKVLLAGGVWSGHLVNRRRDGTIYEEEATISPVRDTAGKVVNYVAVKRDVTDQMALQAQLRQAQKMEAVGQLAGGVAHDFNNLLQALMSTLELLRALGEDPARRATAITELESYVKRGASLTRQLLLFSRRGVTKRERLDLKEVVREASSLLRRLVRENIRVKLDFEPAPLPVYADRSQLEQVLVNLVVNASDAMPEGGELLLRTASRDGESVCFEVQDSGLGIPADLQERIFEPFFTTKGVEKGTGLGLSVVHGIVTGHGGQVELESRVGKGTLFRVVLPRSGERPSERKGAPRGVSPRAGAGAGLGESVLLVEDEEGARHGLAEMLTMLGYQVTSASSGEEAEALPPESPFDLLLTDLLLPGMHGGEVARRMRQRWPRVKVIVMSGYAEDEAVRQGLSQEGTHFLQKPFTLEVLARELRTALAERRR